MRTAEPVWQPLPTSRAEGVSHAPFHFRGGSILLLRSPRCSRRSTVRAWLHRADPHISPKGLEVHCGSDEHRRQYSPAYNLPIHTTASWIKVSTNSMALSTACRTDGLRPIAPNS